MRAHQTDGDGTGASETGALLHSEYRRSAELLRHLDALLARTGDEPSDLEDQCGARPVIEALHDFLSVDFTRHLAFEGDFLCPALAASGMPCLAEILRNEHAALRPLARRLKSVSAGALGERFPRERWSEFRRLSREFVDRMTAHLQAERNVLLAAVEDLFGPEIDRALAMAHRGLCSASANEDGCGAGWATVSRESVGGQAA